jgi:hypothetical protein
MATNPITMTTLVIGADYQKALHTCIKSKVDYAAAQGYTYIQGGETYWDRTKPIAWSKIPFFLEMCSRLPEGALVWQSDADILITNPELRLEDQILPLLPEDKDLLLTLDACGHINSGSILFRNTPWMRDYWRRVGGLTQFTYHIWWENAAMIALYEGNPEDKAKIEVTNQHKRFNAYLRGLSGEPLWTPGDFLVHLAGVYDLKQMESLINMIKAGETPRIPM